MMKLGCLICYGVAGDAVLEVASAAAEATFAGAIVGDSAVVCAEGAGVRNKLVFARKANQYVS